MNYKIQIKGMSCKSCEKKVEETLLEMEHITYARAYSTKNYVVVDSDKEIKKHKVIKALKELPYSCDNVTMYQSTTYEKISNIILIVMVIALLLFGRRYVPNLNSTEGAYVGLSIVLLYGILNSLHCMSMCGGLIVTRIMIVNKGKTKREISLYVLGRILSYTMIGAMLGALGGILSINETFKGFVSVFAGIMMLLLALQLLGYIRLPNIIKQRKSTTKHSSFMLGIMNGFLPCGSLQAMQLYALSTGSLVMGATVMFLFGVTTSLSLVTLAGLTSKIRMQSQKIKVLSVVIISFLGIQFVSQGISQINITTSNEIELIDLDESTKYQTLTLDVTGTYHFDKDEIKVGVPVKLELGVINPDGCSNPFNIVLPSGKKLEIDALKEYTPIVFMPEETGKLKVVCWMNMRSNTINVVE